MTAAPLEPRRDLREQLKPLAARGFVVGEAGDIPAGLVERRDPAAAGRIGHARQDDRDCPRPLFDRLGRQTVHVAGT
jgi:hypothetical protein